VLDEIARHLDRSGCRCDRERIGRRPVAWPASYEIQIVDGVPGKAQIWPGTGRIQVDRRFWAAITQAQRDAVLAHEIAHDEDPSACEACADARAGARMRWMGYSASMAVRSLASIVRSRQAGAAVLAGWRIADDAIRATGHHAAGLRPAEQIAPSSETVGRRGYRMPARVGPVDARAVDGYEDEELQMSIGVPTPAAPSAPPARTTPRTPKPSAPPQPAPSSSSSSSSSSKPTILIIAGVALVAGVVLFRRR
jgi:hypothetical protein